MKVLVIGTDRKLFEEGSSVLERNLGYARKMDELHIIVFSLKKLCLKSFKKENVFVYPTNSNNRWSLVFDAIKIGGEVIREKGFKRNSSVISTQDPFESGFVGARLKNKFDLPLQLQVHTDFLDLHFKNNLLNIIRVFVSKFVIKKAEGIRVVSSVIKDSITKHFPNLKAKIDILPVFVDVENLFERREKSYEQSKIPSSIFMVSRFTKEKRIDVGLEAFKKVLDKHKDAKLFIVGSGEEKESIKIKIKYLGLSGNVKVEDWSEDVPNLLYQKAEMFLLTSEFEGYGMTLVEAGIAGCPIVTTKVGLAKTDLFKDGENSFVCPVGDIECLSNKMIELLGDQSKRELFKNRMQDSIKSIAISKEDYTEKYVSLMKNLLK